MPFTLAHPAVAPGVQRLTRGRLVLSGIVVGSMAPDFEYFVRLAPDGRLGHTFGGLFVWCLPASLVALAAWYLLVRPALATLLSANSSLRPILQERFAFRGVDAMLNLCVSILVGAETHLGWDAFTHSNGFMVSRLPLLASEAAWGVPVHVYLQVLSSAGGMLFLFAPIRSATRLVWREFLRFPSAAGKRVMGFLVAATVVGALANLARTQTPSPLPAGVVPGQVEVTALALGAVAASISAFLAYAVISRFVRVATRVPA